LDALVNEPTKRARRKERREFNDIAEVLCDFFRYLQNDDEFWRWLSTLQNPNKAEVEAFLQGLDAFEDRQEKLLERFGLDAMASAQLATSLSTSMKHYEGLLVGGNFDVAQSVQDFSTYVEKIRDVVCVSDPTLKNVSIGLGAMATVGSMASGIAAATGAVVAGTAASFALPVVIGVVGLGALAARIMDERRNK
jgi:hypothetical protein